jgi:protein-S-isoprenylcysteine O-methyltransferase Ste14
MHNLATLRALALFLPAGMASVLWSLRPPLGRAGVSLALALLWNTAALLLVNALAVRLGWWRFETHGGAFLGAPLDVVLGWSALWGLVVPLAVGRSVLAQAGVALSLDLVAMPRLEPLLHLGHTWLLGEALALVVALVPGALLARWTAEATYLKARGALQAALAGALCFVCLPLGLLAVRGEPARLHLGGISGIVLVEVAILGCVLGIAALQELLARGGGTPFPLDPTQRLVTSGPYAYLANPMQVSAVLLLAAAGGLLRSGTVALAALGAFAYSAGFAHWQEEGDLRRRFGPRWDAYRGAMHDWIPHSRPYVSEPAKLYVAATCDACSELGRWVAARGTVGLEIVPAESSPRPLRRMTYVAADGHTSDGVAALGRALEHAGPGWAILGLWLRLPLVRPLVQLLVDASGGGPREAGTLQACRPPTPSARTSGGSPRSSRRRPGTGSATSSRATGSAT